MVLLNHEASALTRGAVLKSQRTPRKRIFFVRAWCSREARDVETLLPIQIRTCGRGVKAGKNRASQQPGLALIPFAFPQISTHRSDYRRRSGLAPSALHQRPLSHRKKKKRCADLEFRKVYVSPRPFARHPAFCPDSHRRHCPLVRQRDWFREFPPNISKNVKKKKKSTNIYHIHSINKTVSWEHVVLGNPDQLTWFPGKVLELVSGYQFERFSQSG